MGERIYRCPVEVTIEVVGGKWTAVILAHLKENDRLRFTQIRRLIPDITEKMLTQRLRELEKIGIVERTLVSATPPHVEYALTAEGRSLAPMLQSMWEWGRQWAQTHQLSIRPPAEQLAGYSGASYSEAGCSEAGRTPPTSTAS
ncbi:HxlR family transcriptional regulator [Parafrankia colletiae]|uniref:HxlR family transcriptional regulator n=1 Tax=Parafrankia colletiae TaxID=573497 RepID=A0A1S1R3F1_9ACTN|nr:helix-turn-helix domain-containing protein [Parafrankia colletiae]MCK9905130.1 helix-turn-helix transcriptional regulator [Frankia sp. Cpl3]OHV41473.1 HxlR family transcriptional regulator [Parafrankia colletiae]